MAEVLAASLMFPAVIFTVVLALALIYWLFVLVGALDLDLLGGAHGDAMPELGGIEGAAKGALEGAAKGALEGAAKGALEGAAKGALEGTAKGAVEGVADAADGAHGLGSVLVALDLHRVPATVTLTLIAAFGWFTSALSMAASAPTQYVQVGSDKIAYRSIGTGEPMVLITRMRGTLDTWDPLFLDELAKNKRIITVDYPGVGYSDGKLPPGIGQAADFVIAFADAMKLEKFILLGWSWGGTVAQTVVVEHPGRVTHAILVGTAPPGKRAVEIQQAFIDRAFKPVNDLDDEIVLFFEPRSEFSRKMAKESRDRIRVRPGVDEKIPSTPEAIKAYLAAAEEYHVDAAGRLQKLMVTRTPLLIISGDNDISTAVDNWFALNRKIPNAHLAVYPESGHRPQHQHPQLAAEQVASFLRHAIR